ncbi:MAG: aldehyde dehydrogenase family protein [Desulfarculales bacterium]|nr:aldehyde dehydrogenase family protein [Desulfarculales bacterium]
MKNPYRDLLRRQREYFSSGATVSLQARTEALKALGAAINRYTEKIVNALRTDLGKSAGEVYLLELGPVVDGLQHTLNNLEEWMRPLDLPSPPPLQPGKSRIYHQPLGVALIMAPWNYPFQLSFLPLLTALSAGNCAILKPSPDTPRTVETMKECLASAFSENYVALAEGGAKESGILLEEQFDAIFYTGSGRVGRLVMAAAAKRLTPVCLELGGKSPALVTKDARLPIAAKRIAWGKILNAGQTCIAPDYVLADKEIAGELIGLIDEAFREMLGSDPLNNPEYAHIISRPAFERLLALTPEARADGKTLKIAPLVFLAGKEHPAMEEEIFGPLLPVIPYAAPQEALDYIRSREKPLAFYVFSENEEFAAQALAQISSGGACVNDVLMHAASAALPFGGVGASGMGRYHGKYGFDFFSNIRSVLHQSSDSDMPLRYPPFSGEKIKILQNIIQPVLKNI